MNSEYYIENMEEGIFSKFPLLASLGLAAAIGTQAGTNSISKTPQASSKTTNSVVASKTNSVPEMSDFIAGWEGKKKKIYKDTSGNSTIGIGHHVNGTKADRELFSSLFGNNFNYDGMLRGKVELSDEQVKKLFSVDVKHKEKLAQKIFPTYDSFNSETKNAIINSLYRGDMGKKTAAHINKGDWKNAAKEYLRHKNAISGPEQIQRRMQTNAAIFLKNEKPKETAQK